MTHEDEHQHHADHEHHHEPVDYVDAVEGFRAEKDHWFKHADGSPIPADEREAFTGLAYFPVDPSCGSTISSWPRMPAPSRSGSRSRRRTAPAARAPGRVVRIRVAGEPRSPGGVRPRRSART